MLKNLNQGLVFWEIGTNFTMKSLGHSYWLNYYWKTLVIVAITLTTSWKYVLILLTFLPPSRKNTCREITCYSLVKTKCFFFFYQGFLSRTLTTHRTAEEGKGPSYSTLPLPSAHEHSDIYLQLCTWDDYHIFLIATLVFTRLLLDEIYHLIELLFDWLMM